MGIELPSELAGVAAAAGVQWPQADEDAMRASAQAWRQAGQSLSSVTTDADGSATKALAAVSGPTATAAGQHWNGFIAPDSGKLTSTVAGCHSAADQLEHAADQVGEAKVQIVSHLVTLAKNTDAAQQAANAGNPTAMLGIDSAVKGTSANIAQVNSNLTNSIRLDGGSTVYGRSSPVNANPGSGGLSGLQPLLGSTGTVTQGAGHVFSTTTAAAASTVNAVAAPVTGGAHDFGPGAVPTQAGASHDALFNQGGLVGGLTGQGGLTDQAGLTGHGGLVGQGGLTQQAGLTGRGGLTDQAGLTGQGGALGQGGGSAGQGGLLGEGGLTQQAGLTGHGGLTEQAGLTGQSGGPAGQGGQGGLLGQGGVTDQAGLTGHGGVTDQAGLTGQASGQGGVLGQAGVAGQGGVLGGPGGGYGPGAPIGAGQGGLTGHPGENTGPIQLGGAGTAVSAAPGGGYPSGPVIGSDPHGFGHTPPMGTPVSTVQQSGYEGPSAAPPIQQSYGGALAPAAPVNPMSGSDAGFNQGGSVGFAVAPEGGMAGGMSMPAAPAAGFGATSGVGPVGGGSVSSAGGSSANWGSSAGGQYAAGGVAGAVGPVGLGGSGGSRSGVGAAGAGQGAQSGVDPNAGNAPVAPQAGTQARPERRSAPRDGGVALFLVALFPIGHLPVASSRPTRQLPPPPEDVDFAAGSRFAPHDHPDSAVFDAIGPTQGVQGLTEGLTSGDERVRALSVDYDPLGGGNEHDWDRRFLVRPAADGVAAEYAWPPSQSFPEGGCDHGEAVVVAPGTVLDRFGGHEGRVFSVDGTAFGQRSLPPDALTAGYHRYQVVRELPLWWALSTGWFGQPGGGVRYRAVYPAVDLVAMGFLREITEIAEPTVEEST